MDIKYIYIYNMIIGLNKRENGNGLTEIYKRRDKKWNDKRGNVNI